MSKSTTISMQRRGVEGDARRRSGHERAPSGTRSQRRGRSRPETGYSSRGAVVHGNPPANPHMTLHGHAGEPVHIVLAGLQAKVEQLDKRKNDLDPQQVMSRSECESRFDELGRKVDNLHWWLLGGCLTVMVAAFGSGAAIQQMTVQTFQAGGGHRQDLLTITDALAKMQASITGINERLGGIEGRMETMEGRMQRMEGRMQSMEGRMEGMEERMEGIEGRLERTEEHLGLTRAKGGAPRPSPSSSP